MEDRKKNLCPQYLWQHEGKDAQKDTRRKRKYVRDLKGTGSHSILIPNQAEMEAKMLQSTAQGEVCA